MSGLSAKQEKALSALLSEFSITAAAAKAGVTERTVYRWLEETAFSEAYRAARREAVSQAIARLQHFSSAAASVLLQLMADTSPSVRLRAAEKVLDLAIRSIELQDLQARIEALELLLREKQR